MIGWVLRWYTARAVIGCGEVGLPLADLEEALAKSGLPETRWIRVAPANGSEAEVKILTRARHAGGAAARLLDLLAAAAPRGWDWGAARVHAEPLEEGVRRWPRLAVTSSKDEEQAGRAAVALAGYAVVNPDPAVPPTQEERDRALEVLLMCGLTLSAGRGGGGSGA